MKKIGSLILSLCILLTLSAFGCAESRSGYVLMNIPYADFYAAEVTDASGLDAVTSATMAKPRAGSLVGGSYHVGADGADISGVIFPVFVEDLTVLPTLGGTQVTDESSVSITVTLKGKEQLGEYTGAAALFEAPSYSWYVLSEEPVQYKALTLSDKPAFGAVTGKDEAVAAQAAYIVDRHKDVVISVSGLSALDAADVSGVVLTAEDGTRVGLRHLENIWRKTQFGLNLDSAEYAALKGKRITGIRYITRDANYVIETDLPPVIEVSDAAGLAAVNENRSGNYVLTADIDLSGAEWTPLGAFVQQGTEGEAAEMPDLSAAFTGTFDGNGHIISNLVINQPESWSLGLFGCIANAEIGNFTIEKASVDGMTMVSDVVGYAFSSTVKRVSLKDGTVTAHAGEMSGEGMYGGIVGAGMSSLISKCDASAAIVLPDDTANAGIIGGGLEMTSVEGCTATGSVTAGTNCYGLGGISGCGFGSEHFSDCTAENVTITAAGGCSWIGGITGYAGGFEAEEAGIPVTKVERCSTKNVTVSVGEDAEGIGDFVGAGFYSELAAQAMGAPYDAPTVFVITDCTAE